MILARPHRPDLDEPDAPIPRTTGRARRCRPDRRDVRGDRVARAQGRPQDRRGDACGRPALRHSSSATSPTPRHAACGARRTHILGLLLDDLADPVHGKVAAGFEEAAAAQGYAVFIMTGLHDPEREQRALTAFVEHRADGIVVASCVERSRRGACPRPGRSRGLRPARLPGPRGRRRTPGARRPPHRRQRGLRRHWCATSSSAGYRRIAFVGPGSGASDSLRRAAAATALRGAVARTDALPRRRRRWLAGCDVRGPDARRRSAGRRPLLRRQAGARAARCAALDTAGRAARHGPGRVRRHPRRPPVVASADDGRRPVRRGRPAGGRDAGRVGRGTAACRSRRSCRCAS